MRKKLIESILKPKRVRFQAISLAGGTGIAQLIGICATPILTRIFQPDAFGSFSIFLAVTSVLSVIFTLRLDAAIPLPESDKESQHLLIASAFVSGICSALCIPVLYGLINFQIIERWWSWILLTAGFLGIFNSLGAWANRKDQYVESSMSKIVQAILAVTIPIGASTLIPGAQSLICGASAGYLVASIFLSSRLKIFSLPVIPKDIWKSIVKYRRFPQHIMPSHLVGAIHFQIPIVVMGFLYSVEEAGYFGLANRLVAIPTTLISSAIGEVFRQHAAKQFNLRGNFESLFLKTLLYSVGFALPCYSVLYFFGPEGFQFAFGSNWKLAGEFASILAFWGFFSFTTGSVDKGAIIVGATRYVFYWHLSMLITNVALAMAAIFMALNSLQYLAGVVIIKSIHHIVDLGIEWKLSRGRPTA